MNKRKKSRVEKETSPSIPLRILMSMELVNMHVLKTVC